MSLRYRVKIFAGNEGSLPTGDCGHSHVTKAAALVCARIIQEKGHGAAIMCRLFSSEPWTYLPDNEQPT